MRATAGATPEPVASVHFEVVDAGTGKPIRAFSVTPGIVPPNFLSPLWFDDHHVSGADGKLVYSVESSRGGDAVFRVDALGYQPQSTETYRLIESDLTLRVALNPARPVEGVVLDVEGRPVAEAVVGVVDAHILLGICRPGPTGILDSVQRRGFHHAFTDEDGRFAVDPGLDPRTVVAAHWSGYAYRSGLNRDAPVELRLQPYARVAGRVIPAGERDVAVRSPSRRPDPDNPFVVELSTTTDREGRFEIDGLVAGRYEAGRITGGGRGHDSPAVIVDTEFDLASGQEHTLQLGGNGRPVQGKAVVRGAQDTAIDWTFGRYELRTHPPDSSAYPIRGSFDSEAEFIAAVERLLQEQKAFLESEAGKRFAPREYPLEMDAEGTFRTGAIPPGSYIIQLEPGTGRFGAGEQIGEGAVVFTIPTIPEGFTEEPLDLGDVSVYLIPSLRVGMRAPAFEVQDADGKTVRLSDFRGKYLFLEFWATSCGPCVAELPHLREAYEAFQDRPDFEMVGMMFFEEDWEAIRTFMKREPVPWRQCLLPLGASLEISRAFGVHGIPKSFLISPQGIVMEKGLRGSDVYRAIYLHLPKATQGTSPPEEEK